MTVIVVFAIAVLFLSIGGIIAWHKLGALDCAVATHEIRCRRLEDAANLNVVRGEKSFDRMLAECERLNLLKSEKELEEEP